jgi:hypothetical protein
MTSQKKKYTQLPGKDLPLDVYDFTTTIISDHTRGGDHELGSRDLDALEDGTIYEDAASWWFTRRTLLEIAMMEAMNAVTDKPSWHTKILKASVQSRLQLEIQQALRSVVIQSSTPSAAFQRSFKQEKQYERQQQQTQSFETHITNIANCAAEFCIEEIIDKARNLESIGCSTVLGIQGADIAKSDCAVSECLKERLQTLAQALEESRVEADWQPGQEKVVRNLVHPSLYPLYYGRTKYVSDTRISLEEADKFRGCGDTLPVPDAKERYSTQYQWLPAEVQMYQGSIAFTSYINNLAYGDHGDLYEALAELVESSIPLWNQCITTTRGSNPQRVPCNKNDDSRIAASKLPEPASDYRTSYVAKDCDLSNETERQGESFVVAAQAVSSAELDDFHTCPSPTSYQMFAREVVNGQGIDLKRDFKGLQVIVKMANIELTSEHPRYRGGSWHVEDEQIRASMATTDK